MKQLRKKQRNKKLQRIRTRGREMLDVNNWHHSFDCFKYSFN